MTTITLKENEPFDVAIRCFRRTIEKNGLIAEHSASVSRTKSRRPPASARRQPPSHAFVRADGCIGPNGKTAV